MRVTTITIRIHDHLDPECEKYQGVRAPLGLRWMFRCDECRKGALYWWITCDFECPIEMKPFNSWREAFDTAFRHASQIRGGEARDER